MATFVIIPTEKNTTIGDHIKSSFDNKSFGLPNGEWLVSYDGTSKQLSEKIGLVIPEAKVSPAVGSAIVLNFSAYYGWADNSIWEWISENSD